MFKDLIWWFQLEGCMVPRVDSQDLGNNSECRDSMKSLLWLFWDADLMSYTLTEDNWQRSFLSVRTLMDTSGEIWSEDEFNHVQHALKNRILEDWLAISVS